MRADFLEFSISVFLLEIDYPVHEINIKKQSISDKKPEIETYRNSARTKYQLIMRPFSMESSLKAFASSKKGDQLFDKLLME